MLKLSNGKNVFLDFERLGNDVSIVAIDRNGEKIDDGYIVSFATNGKLILHSNVNREIGFQLGEDSCIRTR